jgi:hypothetical protein
VLREDEVILVLSERRVLLVLLVLLEQAEALVLPGVLVLPGALALLEALVWGAQVALEERAVLVEESSA